MRRCMCRSLRKLHASSPRPEPAYLEGFVCVEVQRQAGVGEEEVQSPIVEQVVAAHLLGKGLDGTWVDHRVQQAHLPCTGRVWRGCDPIKSSKQRYSKHTAAALQQALLHSAWSPICQVRKVRKESNLVKAVSENSDRLEAQQGDEG